VNGHNSDVWLNAAGLGTLLGGHKMLEQVPRTQPWKAGFDQCVPRTHLCRNKVFLNVLSLLGGKKEIITQQLSPTPGLAQDLGWSARTKMSFKVQSWVRKTKTNLVLNLQVVDATCFQTAKYRW
jgi:hypothetical protein